MWLYLYVTAELLKSLSRIDQSNLGLILERSEFLLFEYFFLQKQWVHVRLFLTKFRHNNKPELLNHHGLEQQ